MSRIKPIREYSMAGAQYAYLLDQCIDGSNYKGDFTDDRAKIYLVLSNYKSWVKDNNKPNTWSTGKHIGDWLRGLPSCCRVAFADAEIIRTGRSWGMPLKTYTSQSKFVDQWWTGCGQRLLEIAVKLKISLYKIKPYDNERGIQEQMEEAGV